MKKKLLVLFLTLIVCFALIFVLVACNINSGGSGNSGDNSDSGNNGGNTHQHTYATEWSYDETYHWHSATCEHKNEVKDRAEHTYGQGNVCDVCGYEKPEIVPEGLVFELNEDGESYFLKYTQNYVGSDINIPSVYKGKPVTQIGDGSQENGIFYNYEGTSLSFNSIVIPASVTNIEDYAFASTTQTGKEVVVGKIVVPATVTTLGKRAFNNARIDCLQFEKDNPVALNDTTYSEIFLGMHSKQVYLSDAVERTPSFRDMQELEFVYIGSGTRVISANCFKNCKNLKQVDLTDAESLGFIYSEAFAESGIEKIDLPASLRVIQIRVFEKCENLKEVNFLGTNITEINSAVFSECTALKKIVLPEGVVSCESQPSAPFLMTTGLESITFPSTFDCESREIKNILLGADYYYKNTYSLQDIYLNSPVVDLTAVSGWFIRNSNSVKQYESNPLKIHLSKNVTTVKGTFTAYNYILECENGCEISGIEEKTERLDNPSSINFVQQAHYLTQQSNSFTENVVIVKSPENFHIDDMNVLAMGVYKRW